MQINKLYNGNFVKNPVPYGTVQFKINQAISSTIHTSNGVADVFNLNISLTNLQTGEQKVLKSYNLFVSDKPHSSFAQFLNQFLEKINDEGFSLPNELVGITGKVSYFQNKHGYDDLNKWEFDIPSPVAQQQLQQHIRNNQNVQLQKSNFSHTPSNNIHQSSLDDRDYSHPHMQIQHDYTEPHTYDPTQDTDASIPENPHYIDESEVY